MTNAINEMVKNARDAMKDMQKQFNVIKQEAARSAMEEIINSGKPMTRRDIANITGLTMDEVERYMDNYINRNYPPYNTDNRPLMEELKTFNRTYALVNEDGSIDRNNTATIPYRGYVYSPAPGAKNTETEQTGAEVVAAILKRIMS